MARKRPAGSDSGAAKPAASLGEALGAFLRESGIQATLKNPELHEKWQKIVGPDIGKHTGVSGYNRGVLEVAVDSSALRSDLEFHRAALLRDVQSQIKKPFVQRLSFILMPMQESHDAG